jgi:hypothetical protein
VTLGSAQAIDPISDDSQIEAARPALEPVLASHSFERAPTLRRLLQYLWDHRDEEISEYAIATEALKRRPDFEPRYDATVRVLVSRLRQRLKEFYEEDGAKLATRIVIPLGTHQIQVVEVEQHLSIEPTAFPASHLESFESEQRGLNRIVIFAQFALIALLMCSTGWLLWERNHKPAQAAQADPLRLHAFWTQFLGNGKTTRLIVPNPIFFAFGDGIMVRDIHVNDYLALKNSKALTSIRSLMGRPALAQQYVAASDAFAALRLDSYLESHGIPITISTTADASMDALDHENVIVAGNSHTLTSLGVANRLSFQMDTNNWRVLNRKPMPGEPAEFDTVNESKTRMVTPGVIASLPGGPAGTHVLVLITTYHTAALVAYLTSENGIRQLEQAQAAHGNCRYFEAVIVSQIEGNTELGGNLALFHPYSPR